MKQKFYWTEEKIDELKNIWNTKSLYKIAADFHTTEETIIKKASEIGLEEYKSNRWTKEEEELLREYSKKYVTKTIAKKLGRSYLAVQKKAVKLGIELHGTPDPWKKWMIDYLKDNINKQPIGQIESMIGLSYYSILTKCKELGIEYVKESWTEEEIKILREYADKCHYTELTKVLPNRTIGAITAKAYELGIETITAYTKLDDKQIKYIKDNWGEIPATEIARNLKISIGILNRYKKELNLPNTGQQKKWTEEKISKLRKDAKTKTRNELAKKYKTSPAQISAISRKNNIKLIDSKIIWTGELVSQLEELINQGLDISEISKKMGMKASSIRQQIRKMNNSYDSMIAKSSQSGIKIKNYSNKRWTKEEETELLELLTSYSSFEVAEILERSEEAIIVRATNLGYNIDSKHRRWTKEEETLLSDLWGLESIENITKKLNRTESSIINRVHVLGLGSQIEKNYDGLRIQDISDIFQVDRNVILTSWVSLGLKLSFRKRSNHSVYSYVQINDLYEFLEANQNIWDSRNLEKNILGAEPVWLKEKRTKDRTLPADEFGIKNLTKQQLLLAKQYFLDSEQVKENIKTSENVSGTTLIKTKDNKKR